MVQSLGPAAVNHWMLFFFFFLVDSDGLMVVVVVIDDQILSKNCRFSLVLIVESIGWILS